VGKEGSPVTLGCALQRKDRADQRTKRVGRIADLNGEGVDKKRVGDWGYMRKTTNIGRDQYQVG